MARHLDWHSRGGIPCVTCDKEAEWVGDDDMPRCDGCHWDSLPRRYEVDRETLAHLVAAGRLMLRLADQLGMHAMPALPNVRQAVKDGEQALGIGPHDPVLPQVERGQ